MVITNNNQFVYIYRVGVLHCFSIKSESLLFKTDRSVLNMHLSDMVATPDSRFLYFFATDSSEYKIWSIEHQEMYDYIKFPYYDGKHPGKYVRYAEGWDETRMVCMVPDNSWLLILCNGYRDKTDHIDIVNNRGSYLPGLGN